MSDREFWLAIRQALLMIVDAIEKHSEINPRTAELRKHYRNEPIAPGLKDRILSSPD